MASLNKYKRRTGLGWVASAARRRWVVLKLKLGWLSGIGRGPAAVHDIFSAAALLVSSLNMLLGKAGSLLWQALLPFVRKGMELSEPLTDMALGVLENLKTKALSFNPAQLQKSRLMPVSLLLTATICVCTASYLGVGLKVEINGKAIGYVSSKSEMEGILDEVEDRISEYLGAPYSLNLDVSYSIGFDDGSGSLDRDIVSDYVMAALDNVSAAYVLTVNGEVVGANQSKTALKLLKQRMLEANAVSYKGGELSFVQDVEVRAQGSGEATVMSIDSIEEKLSGNTKESVVYTVNPGDTVSEIAEKYSTSVASILSINPGLQTDMIHAGDKITISASVPYLSVQETVTENYVKLIGYETTKQTTDDLYTTQSRVIKEGVYGEANVVADVVYVNGEEQSRVIMDWQVTKEPENEVIEVGTKTPPAKSATGNFMKPSNGVFSSGYGYRRSLGDFHTGVDFAGAIGTSIYASDGGKVTFAGWKGNYGYCVFIDHQNGFVTVYAHCSKLLVKAGQSVAKGETIARVGNTGRSTGPHVHFEIRYNGQTVNPLNYINK